MQIVTEVLAALILAVSLSLDELTVCMSIGTRMHGKLRGRDYAHVIIIFVLMHVAFLGLGFLIGDVVRDFVEGFGSWISLALLAFVGIVMIYSAIKGEENESEEKNLLSIPPLRRRAISALALACSIDALAVGSSLGLSGDMPLALVMVTVSIITVAFAWTGLKLGSAAGQKWEKPAEVIAGLVLIAIGIKSLF